MRKDGRITAVECECDQRGGAHSGYGVVTILYSGSMLYAIYDLHNVRYVGRRVLTNTPPCGAFRGHGTVDVRFAFESLLDEMARELGLDPIAVRRANYLPPPGARPTFTDNDLMVASYGLPECVDWVERESEWHARRGKLASGNGVRKGLGFACSHYISGASKPVNWTGEPHATVKIKLDFDGSVVVLSGAADIGQGSSTILVQAVAEVLGLDMSRVRVITGDSEVVPKDNGSYSSRVTFMVGNAAIDAAQNLKRGAGRGRRAQARGAARGHRVPGRALSRRRAGQGRDLPGGRHRSLEGHRHHHGDRQLLDHPGFARRQEIPRRRDRRHHGLQLFGAGGRGVGRRRDRCRHRRQGVGGARLRQGAQPAVGRRPGAGLGLDGHGPGDERGGRLSRRPDAHRQHARLPRADHRGLAADRGRHRREQRSERAVRRQGSGRGVARRVPAGADQRHRRRHRAALQRPAGDARPRVRRARKAPARRGAREWPRAVRTLGIRDDECRTSPRLTSPLEGSRERGEGGSGEFGTRDYPPPQPSPARGEGAHRSSLRKWHQLSGDA